MNKKNSFKISLGGILSAISLTLMLMCRVFPLMSYAFPAMAGVLTIIIVIEINVKWAVLTYATVALLSIFLSDPESATLFIAFLGYYPILKGYIERLNRIVIEWIIKIAIFNVSIVLSYLILIKVLGVVDLTEEAGDFGKYTTVVLLAMANLVFVIYDLALTKIITRYIKVFRPKFLRKFR